MNKTKLLLCALLLIPAASQAKTLEDLLVEKGVITKGEASSAMGSSGAKVSWNKGTRIDFPDEGFSAQVNSLIASRYTYTDADEDAGAESTSSFEVTKARIAVSGNALHNEFYYKVEGDFVKGSTEDGEADARLTDAYIGWQACDWLDLRMGQFKTGISKQFNVSEYALQFPDRSIASDFFDLDRQNGLMGTTNFMDGQVWLSAGIYNGESDGEGINRPGTDQNHTGIVNLRWNAMGSIDPKSESDVDWTDDPALQIGAAYAFSDRETADGDFDNDTINVDATFMYQGWSLQGEYYVANGEFDTDGDDSSEIEPQGFYVQLGYFLDPKTLEVAARYSLVDCDDGATDAGVCSLSQSNEKVNEVNVSINYYWWKHHLKGQLGFTHLNERGLGDLDDINTNLWMFQLSSYF